MTSVVAEISRREVSIPSLKTMIKGGLSVPEYPKGLIIFAHGLGSSRKSKRDRYVADILHQSGFATLLIDLHSEREASTGSMLSQKLRGDLVPYMAGHVDAATEWVLHEGRMSTFPIGFFGASVGAAAALTASLQRPQLIRAIVCRGGRPDLAEQILPDVRSPVLFIVGDKDTSMLQLNRTFIKKLKSERKLTIVPGASHFFEESGKLDEVAAHAKSWFEEHLTVDVI